MADIKVDDIEIILELFHPDRAFLYAKSITFNKYSAIQLNNDDIKKDGILYFQKLYEIIKIQMEYEVNK